MESVCRGCGTGIVPSGKRGRPRSWCSTDCYWKHYVAPRKYPTHVKQQGRRCKDCGAGIDHRHGRAFLCEHCCKVRQGVLPAPLEPKTCLVCSEKFTPARRDAKYCSKECRDRRSRQRVRKRRYTDADRARDQRKQALRRGAATGRPVVLCEIGDRDDWQCELCGNPVDRWLEYPDPLSPSLDHILPVSLGGIHDPSNVRVTHLRCNIRRGNRIDHVAEVS